MDKNQTDRNVVIDEQGDGKVPVKDSKVAVDRKQANSKVAVNEEQADGKVCGSRCTIVKLVRN